MASKSIAKNTIFLYFRMMCVMAVTLYTSRVVLRALGVTDFGVYQTVGGIVTLFSFLNSALSSGSSRFLTFELGKGVILKLKRTFSTLLIIHIVLAVFIVILCETFGLWFLNNHVELPIGRVKEANLVFQFSIFTSILTITQVPYTSVIIAHEDLEIYAYASIIECVLKLLIAYIIQIVSDDKLIWYAFLLAFVQIIIMMIYRIFCKFHYEESRLDFKLLDIKILREVGGFSSWSLFAAVSVNLTNQGTLILLNNFFSPAVVSARTIVLTVNNAANQFIQNFRTAANPQVIKRYAIGDYESSKNLLLKSTAFSYYLMLLLALPIFLLSEPLLSIWLGDIPEFSIIFLQWIMVQSLFCVFDTSLYTALFAMGRLRENALISPVLGIIQFPILYYLFKNGYSPLVLCYCNCVLYAVLGLVIKPLLVCIIAKYKLSEILILIGKCFLVTIFSIPVPFFVSKSLNIFTVKGFVLVGFVSVLMVVISSFSLGCTKEDREMIRTFILRKIKRN